MSPSNIGICSWSIHRHDVPRAITFAGTELDLRVTQIGFFVRSALRAARAGAILQAARAARIAIAGSFVGFEGEDYSSIERIAATGGYAPDETYAKRLEMTRDAAALTVACGSRLVAVHAATIPTDTASERYRKLVDRVGEVADAVARQGAQLLLETGREPVDALIAFLRVLDRDDVGINFDPGNLVIYGADEPATVVCKLADRIRITHLKDAVRSSRPGIEYGKPAPLGTGDAQIAQVVGSLRTTGYTGPLLLKIPASAGDLRRMVASLDFLRSLLGRDESSGGSSRSRVT